MATLKLAQIFDTTVSNIAQQFNLVATGDSFENLVLDGNLSSVNATLTQTDMNSLMQPDRVPLTGPINGVEFTTLETVGFVEETTGEFVQTDLEDEEIISTINSGQFSTIQNNITSDPLAGSYYSPTKASAYLLVSGKASPAFVLGASTVIDASNHNGILLTNSEFYALLSSDGTGGGCMIVKGQNVITIDYATLVIDSYEVLTDAEYEVLATEALEYDTLISTDFSTLTSGEVEELVSELSVSSTIYPLFDYPIQTSFDTPYTFYIRIKNTAMITIGLNYYLDKTQMGQVLVDGSSGGYVWASFTLVIPDRNLHLLSLQPTSDGQQIDKIVVMTGTITPPTGTGPAYSTSPFVTVHGELYDTTASIPTTRIPSYSYVTSLGTMQYDGWQNFNVTPLDTFSFYGPYAFALTVSGGGPGHFVTWDIMNGLTQYPSSAFNGTSWANNTTTNFSLKMYSQRTWTADCNVTVDSAEQYNLAITNFDANRSTFLNTEVQSSRVVLDLPHKIVTFVLDESGDMTWNDQSGERHTALSRLAHRIENTYPGGTGNVSFNLVTFQGTPYTIALFASTTDYGSGNPVDIADEYFQGNGTVAGIRLIRKLGSASTSPIDGVQLKDGIFDAFEDTGLTTGLTYYYTIFSYDSNGRFGAGSTIAVTPEAPATVFGVTNLTSTVVTGTGTNLDSNVVACWHMGEGSGNIARDFAYRLTTDTRLDLTLPAPRWSETADVPVGNSGLSFDAAGTAAALTASTTTGAWCGTSLTLMMWVYFTGSAGEIISRQTGGSVNYILAINSSGNLTFSWADGGAATTLTTGITANVWTHVAVVVSSGGSPQITAYKNGTSAATGSLTGSRTNHSAVAMPIRVGYQFPGMLTDLSVHATARNSTYVSTAHTYQAANPLQDNGDRLIVLNWFVPSQATGTVQVVEKFASVPTNPNDGTQIYSQSLTAGNYSTAYSAAFVQGQTYNFTVFTQSGGSYSLMGDSPSASVVIPVTKGTLPAPSSAISTLTSFVATGANSKVSLTWAFPADPAVIGVTIYRSTDSFPIIASSGSTGTQVYSGDLNTTTFVDDVGVNDSVVYYAAVTVNSLGQTSAVSFASVTPTSNDDQSTLPLPAITGVYYEPVAADTVVVGWTNPINFSNGYTGWVTDDVLIYGVIFDEFGNPVTSLSNVTFQASASATTSSLPNVFGNQPVDPITADLYTLTGDYNANGLVKGGLQVIADPIGLTGLETLSFSITMQAEQVDDSGDVVFSATSQPISVTLNNPLTLTITNPTNDTVVAQVHNADNTFSSYTTPGCYAGRSSPVTLEATVNWKGQPVNQVSLATLVYDTPQNVFYNPDPVVDTTDTSTLVFTDQVSYSVAGTSAQVQVITPSVPDLAIIYFQANYNGYYVTQSYPIAFLSPLVVQVTTQTPVADGTSYAEQFCRVWEVNPNDPAVISIPQDGTVVSWTLGGGDADIQPFYSTDSVSLSDGVYSTTVNGTARHVYLGPLNGIPPTGEVFTVTATVVADGLTGTDTGYCTVPPSNIGKPGFVGTIFFAQFPELRNSLWADGEDYLKLVIVHNPTDGTISDAPLRPCFVSCSGTIGNDLTVVLPPGLLVQVNTQDTFTIYWGDVTETTATADDGSTYNVIDTSNASNALQNAIVPLANSNETYVYFKMDKTNLTGQTIPIPTQIENCACFFESFSYGTTAAEVSLQSSLLIGGQTRNLVAGGAQGLPPLVIDEKEPLDILVVDIRTSSSGGTDEGHIGDTYVPSDVFVVDGTSWNEIIFQITWRGGSVPDNTPVTISFEGSGLNLTTSVIYTLKQDPSNPDLLLNPEGDVRSYARLYVPPLNPNVEISSVIQAVCAYDKLGLVVRNQTALVSISYTIGTLVQPGLSTVFNGQLQVWNQGTGLWSQPAAMMPNPRAGLAVQTIGTKFYAIGGMNGRTITSYNECYDTVGLTWTELTSLPTPRTYSQSVVATDPGTGHQKIYVIGGIGVQEAQLTVLPNVEAFDPLTNAWVTLADLPTDSNGNLYSVAMGNAFVSSGHIYVVGGFTTIAPDNSSVLTYNDSVLIYNLTTNTWAAPTVMPSNQQYLYQRIGANAWYDGTKLNVLGGWNDSTYMTTAFSYTPNASSVVRNEFSYSLLPPPSYRGGVADLGCTQLVVIGGSTPAFPNSPLLWKYDLTANPHPITAGNNMPIGVNSFGTTLVGSNVFVVGGVSSGRPSNWVQISLNCPSAFNLDGRNSVGIEVNLLDRNGQTPSTMNVLVNPIATNPILMTNRTVSVASGFASTVIYPRSADPSPGTEDIQLQGIVMDTFYNASTLDTAPVSYTPESLNLYNKTVSINGSIARSSTDRGVFATTSQSVSSPFLLLPQPMAQGLSQSITGRNQTPAVPIVTTVLGGNNSTAADIDNALHLIGSRIPQGGSPFYDALQAAMAVNYLDQNGYDKVFYTFSSSALNQSSNSAATVLSNLAGMAGVNPVPIIPIELQVQTPLLEGARVIATNSIPLETIAEATQGETIALISTVQGNVDELVGDLAGRITGAVGYGTFQYDIDLYDEVQLVAMNLTFTVPANTSVSWKFSTSTDGFSYSDWSFVYGPANSVELGQLGCRFVRMLVSLYTGMSTTDSVGSDSVAAASPSLNGINLIFNRKSVDYIYLLPATLTGQVDDAVLSVNGEASSGATVEVGLATADTADWRRFQNGSRPALRQNGKTVMPFRVYSNGATAVAEELDSLDGFLFQARYGPWEPNATITVTDSTGSAVDDDLYSVFPDSGIVCFSTRKTGIYYLTVVDAKLLKMGIKVTSTSPYSTVSLNGAGVMYSQR